MVRNIAWLFGLLALAACSSESTTRTSGVADNSHAPLTVMSFNIRYGTAKDGDNHWDKRKELCASRVTHFNPDILGLQEALDFQNDFLLKTCPGYTAVEAPRQPFSLIRQATAPCI
jgi:hypothetical protein